MLQQLKLMVSSTSLVVGIVLKTHRYTWRGGDDVCDVNIRNNSPQQNSPPSTINHLITPRFSTCSSGHPWCVIYVLDGMQQIDTLSSVEVMLWCN